MSDIQYSGASTNYRHGWANKHYNITLDIDVGGEPTPADAGLIHAITAAITGVIESAARQEWHCA